MRCSPGCGPRCFASNTKWTRIHAASELAARDKGAAAHRLADALVAGYLLGCRWAATRPRAHNEKEFETLQVDRIFLFAIKTMAKQGRYIFRANVDKPFESFLNMLPDFRWVEAMHKKYLELGQKHKDESEDIGETAGETFRSGHVNELQDAIVIALSGRTRRRSPKYLAYLAKNYTNQDTRQIQDQYLQDVDSSSWARSRR